MDTPTLVRTTLRPIQPDDVEELKRGLKLLSPETRLRRFHHPVSELSEDQWRYLTHVDGVDHVALVACLDEECQGFPAGTIVGVGRFIRDKSERNVAEVAFVVHDDVQRRGVGRKLRDAIKHEALARGIDVFRAHMLPSNMAIRRLLDAPWLARLRESGGAIDFRIAA